MLWLILKFGKGNKPYSNLNTSHVKVNRFFCKVPKYEGRYLNTSHVKVNLQGKWEPWEKKINLNTSHVKVNLV